MVFQRGACISEAGEGMEETRCVCSVVLTCALSPGQEGRFGISSKRKDEAMEG